MKRGAPLIATPARWLAGSLVLTAALVGALAIGLNVYVTLSHAHRPIASPLTPVAFAFAVSSVVLWIRLRTDELRLARELRIARTGTSVIRATVTHRRGLASFLAPNPSTRLGRAAVFLADGDRSEALDAFSGGSPLMRGGRLEKLRRVVEADLERAAGTSAGRDDCVRRLRAMAPIGNREADLYRLHVLAKALLEEGDASGGSELAHSLEASNDGEERLYGTWLRTWFDLDAAAGECGGGEGAVSWAPLPEGDLRMAALLARAQGADKLVEKLEGRVAAIARPAEGE
ncbi:MAG: hypothetical protein WBY94_17815 [Polyangiaceae bacterium]